MELKKWIKQIFCSETKGLNMLKKFLVCRTSNGHYVTGRHNDGSFLCNSKKINDALLFSLDITFEEYVDVYVDLVKNQGYFDIEFILYCKKLDLE